MDEVGIFVSCAVKSKIITLERMKKMKSNAIVSDIWHFDNKIGMNGLEGFLGIKVDNIKPQVDRRMEFWPQQPFRGLNINGSLHMAIQTGVLIETIAALGTKVHWCSLDILRTQDRAAAAIA